MKFAKTMVLLVFIIGAFGLSGPNPGLAEAPTWGTNVTSPDPDNEEAVTSPAETTSGNPPDQAGDPARKTREFVVSLYKNILLRDPDPAGLEFWVKKILTAPDQAAAMKSAEEYFRASPEAAGRQKNPGTTPDSQTPPSHSANAEVNQGRPKDLGWTNGNPMVQLEAKQTYTIAPSAAWLKAKPRHLSISGGYTGVGTTPAFVRYTIGNKTVEFLGNHQNWNNLDLGFPPVKGDFKITVELLDENRQPVPNGFAISVQINHTP